MRTTSIFSVFLVASVAFIGLQSCDTSNPDDSETSCGETNISAAGDDESHNNGANCMSCHTNGGDGEGCFTLAGSVYEPQTTTPLPNVTLKLYTAAQGGGELRFTLNGDAIGNVFTTENVDYMGLYASLTGPSGTPHYMSTPLSNGSCNTCHGVSTDRLWAD